MLVYTLITAQENMANGRKQNSICFSDSLSWLVEFVAKFLQFQPEVQQKFSQRTSGFVIECNESNILYLNFMTKTGS